MPPVDLSQQILDAAGNPASATIDGNNVTAVPLRDLIAADQYLKAVDAVNNGRSGLRRTRIAPPGPV